jgi:hypothetical protein
MSFKTCPICGTEVKQQEDVYGTMRDWPICAHSIHDMVQALKNMNGNGERDYRLGSPPENRAALPDVPASVPVEVLEDLGYSPEQAKTMQTTTKPKPRLAAYTKFPVQLMPPKEQKLIRQGAKSHGVDEAAFAIPVLMTAAASIGTSRRLRLKNKWAEFPILWSALVQGSGSNKTSPFSTIMEPLKVLWERENTQYQEAKAIYDSAVADRKGNKGAEYPGDAPTLNHIYTSNTTIEALLQIMLPRGLLVYRDELSGWFGSFGEYKGKNCGDESEWLELYRGDSKTITRITRGTIYRPRAAAWILGTIQPEKLRACLGQERFYSGLAARMMFVSPPTFPAKWTDDDLDESTQAA